jgi:hypothetical protein
MVAAAYGREVGKRMFGLVRGQEAYRESIQSTRRQALSARNKLTEPLVPVPTLAPNYPPMQNSSLPIFQGILGAAAGAFSEAGSDENNLFSNDRMDGDLLERDFDAGDYGAGSNYIYSPQGWS